MSAPRSRAWCFPHPDLDAGDGGPLGLRLSASGGIALARDEAAVRQGVLLLLSTVPGERVMRPDYGCELYRLAFAPNDDTTAGLAIHYVRRALERWEPRIDRLHVEAWRDADDARRLDLFLEYRVRATQRPDRVSLGLHLAGGTL
ncbi:GPW/gp25 family protein [Archangium primigenium]|uniref:GPW/gp25 family protein n=1 Tax=[Archangium] primigenium TaxID=2792470 RepID=UPI00195BADC1|nr:GPW/gp25 family protein [Archangium primigenium]MBM7116785.1 GPW/gp25 family protein [Archangium primigenium]